MIVLLRRRYVMAAAVTLLAAAAAAALWAGPSARPAMAGTGRQTIVLDAGHGGEDGGDQFRIGRQRDELAGAGADGAGGYVRRLPEDPWGNPYQYRQPGENGAVDIWSFGADGQAGGEGDDADIGNW